MKLQVEEDAVAALDQRPHQRGAFRREQVAADLQAADPAADLGRHRQRRVGGVEVQRDEDRVHAGSGVCVRWAAPTRSLQPRDAVTLAVLGQAFQDLPPDEGVDEVGGAHLHGRGAGDA